MEVHIGPSVAPVQIECSPGTQKMFENNPEILQSALSEAGILGFDEATRQDVGFLVNDQGESQVKCHNKQTGRNRAKCPFESEMKAIMGDRTSVFPKLILGASGSGKECTAASLDDTLVPPGNENLAENSEPGETEVGNRQTPSKKAEKIDVGAELCAIRETREEYMKNFTKKKARILKLKN